MNRINVNKSNSIIIDERLFITGLKMSQISEALVDLHIIRGNTRTHPTFWMMYEYDGKYSRS